MIELKNKEWYCPDDGVSIDWIEDKAIYLLENFIIPDHVYMSRNVYDQFCASMGSKQRITVPNQPLVPTIQTIVTLTGPLKVVCLEDFVNFCYVGTKASFNQLVRTEIDEAFEEAFLKDCERE